jgi:hypothetical protein
MKLGSQRKGYIPSKFDKSPFLNLANNGGGNNILLQNGVSLSGDKGGRHQPGGSSLLPSSSGGDMPLSIAARKKEMQAQAEQTAQVIEKNKKKVLDALNKNYRKK